MFNIGILQLTQHLDDAVKGFKEGLRNLNVDVTYHYLNADGNIAELPKLADLLATKKVDLIFACSTPAAKAAVALTENIPVLFTPVFDPVSVNLVESMNKPNGKATGMSGMVAAPDKLAFIKNILPNAKKIALLYHNADDNSVIEKNNILKNNTTLAIQEIALTSAEDISLLEEKLSPSFDALFLTIGKIMEENFASIVYYADAQNIPIIASHAPTVSAGALGALVSNHFKLGLACANQAKSILIDKKNPSDIPVGITTEADILLNAFVAENLEIEIPSAVLTSATEIFE